MILAGLKRGNAMTERPHLSRNFLALIVLCLSPLFGLAEEAVVVAKPLFRDFIGINGHTIQFKPELYSKVCAVVRDYHPMEWDTGFDTDYKLDFPFARNRVSWEQVYGSWRKYGFYNDVSIMFETVPVEKWKSLKLDSYQYGRRFAESFGPSSSLRLVDAVEIGNEPGKFSDEQYRTVFENMAKGLREGDPKLKIATCNVNVGASGDYHKSVDCVAGLSEFYDILNIHSYALLQGWPTWKRSFPEDEGLAAYTQDIDKLIAWKNEHVPSKEIWLTEFGWDSSTLKPNATGDFSKWVGNTDLEQAQWLVRSFFLFAKRDVQRAFIYFFNDDDTPQFHGASGLTRKFEPKPSFYAIAHLFSTLGDYRFARVVRESQDNGCVYEFTHESNPSSIIWVAWSPTGTQKSLEVEIEIGALKLLKTELMPIAAEPTLLKSVTANGTKVELKIGESPVYLFLEK